MLSRGEKRIRGGNTRDHRALTYPESRNEIRMGSHKSRGKDVLKVKLDCKGRCGCIVDFTLWFLWAGRTCSENGRDGWRDVSSL